MLARGGKSWVAEASGAGAKPLIELQPGLLEALDQLVHVDTRGDPMSLLNWTSKSTAKLAGELSRRGFKVSADTVGRLLKRLVYSLLSPAKVEEGMAHPDRDGQFKYLHGPAAEFVTAGDPVISVDTKKNEMVGVVRERHRNGRTTTQPTPLARRLELHARRHPKRLINPAGDP